MLDKKTATANIKLGLLLGIFVAALFVATLIIGLLVVNV
jgi:hypothetical protein